jgi:hypothetical protein
VKRVVIALALLTASCSLPLPEGVHVSKAAPAVDSDPGEIQVMPPGPQEDAPPEAVVRGFLGAASSPEASYGIARKFLTTDAKWAQDQVQVYDPARLEIEPAPATARQNVVVSVSFTQVGTIDRDGRYASVPHVRTTETYPLKQDAQQQWRITAPPRGTWLTPADRERSFPARRVYFLSHPGQVSPHVVPDQVLLPVGGPPGRAELTRLLSGPSAAIAGSVGTAFPPGTTLVSVTSRSGGLYDVVLSPQVLRANDLQRQQLSAQLVWTLRSLDPRFRGLRIKAGSEVLKVPGEDAVQEPADWDQLDPEGLAPGPAYYVAGGRVRALSGGKQGPGPTSTRDVVGVEAVALSPDRKQVAVVQPGGIRRGAVSARTLPLVPGTAGAHALTWGTGERGTWFLDRSGRVQLLDSRNRIRTAAVAGITGRVTWLAVARDGVRTALVINGGLYVGTITPPGAPLAVVNLTNVVPEITGVTRVAWRDPTTAVALGEVSRTFVPVLVSVDGSSIRPLPVSGLPSKAIDVAASSLGVITTAGGRLFQLSNLGFRPGPNGSAPAYPG